MTTVAHDEPKNVIYGLYCTCHPEMGIRYVGQTCNIKKRLQRHFSDSRRGVSLPVYNWIRKHGEQNIVYKILEESPTNIDQSEIYWIGRLSTLTSDGNGGKNVLSGGRSRRGFTTPEETRAKISAAHKGKTISIEQRHKISNSMKNRKTLTSRIYPSVNSGSSNAGAKLTEEQVHEIRGLQGSNTSSQVAIIFNVHRTTVSSIWRGKKWKSLG